jgi:superfamily II DNA or RNA helicase
MSKAPPHTATTVDATEAFAALVHLAGKKPAPIPSDLLARHVLALPGDWDWPVRRAAMEAVLRRLHSMREQGLGVLDAPGRSVWGRYRLHRDGDPLPYEVWLRSLLPLRGSCDCADFVRGALGLCKHLLATMNHLTRRRGGLGGLGAAPRGRGHRIIWDATAGAPGPTDPLQSLGFVPDPGRRPLASVRSLFRPVPDGPWPLVSQIKEPALRLSLVSALLGLLRRPGIAGEPAARAVLVEERARLVRVVRLQEAAPRLRQAIKKVKRRLYAYQREGVERFLVEGRLVLADDMGLGKTTQAIVAASALAGAGLVRRGLLVVPASLKPQWEREWREITDVPLIVVEGGAEERRRHYERKSRGCLLTNYEQVVRDFDAIAAWAPDLVVLDEAQRIKNWATKTALTLKRIKPDYRLVLTGTPMENRIDELASIVEWVDDRALEPKWRLSPWHSAYADGQKEVVGARNLDTLRARLRPVLLRRVRTEVLAQLPARQDTVVPVDLTAEQRESHDHVMQPLATLAAIARRRPLTQAEFLRLMSLLLTQRVVANGMAQLNFREIWPAIRNRAPTPKLIESLGSPKLLELRELISSLVVTQRRKVVVFSQWRRMLELAAWAVSDVLAGDGSRSLFFTGQEGPRRRTQNLVDFNDDPQAKVLFLTDAGGVGLNLQKAATACINLELPWNPAVLEQRIGRIHRLGQKKPIDVYNLVSRNCIEERIANLVMNKRALFKGLFEGTSDQVKFDGRGAMKEILVRLTEPAGNGTTTGTVPGDEGGADTVPVAPAAPEVPELREVAPRPGVDEVEAMVAAADPAASIDADVLALTQADSDGVVARLFTAVTVQRAADGGISIQAPPHAARSLLEVFEGMARMLGAVAGPPEMGMPGNATMKDAVDAFG